MPELWTNNAGSTLAAGIADTDLALTVQPGDGALFPNPSGDFFFCTLQQGTDIEIVEVTARSADTFTIVRAQQGTSALNFGPGTRVELRLTVATLETFASGIGSVTSGLSTHIGQTAAHGATGAVVGTTNTQTLTNKTIAAGSNTITGLADGNISASAAIALSKLANVTASRALVSDASGFITASAVSATELGYLGGVTSGIQTQLGNRVVGPASATDNAVVRFDATTGKLVQNSTAILEDSGNLRLGGAPNSARLTIRGAGTTSATTAMIVENSAGVGVLTVSDDRRVIVGENTVLTTTGGFVLNYAGKTPIAGGLYFNRVGNEPFFAWARDGVDQCQMRGITNGMRWTDANGSVEFMRVEEGQTTITGRTHLAGTGVNSGLQLHRVTTAQRDAITGLAGGLMVFNTDTNRPNFYDGSTWVAL